MTLTSNRNQQTPSVKLVSNKLVQTEAGIVPSDWPIKPLENLVQFLDGQRRPVKASDRERMSGLIPYYGASGIVDYVNDYLFDDDLILLGEDGENILSRVVPLAFRISGKAWVNNHAHVLKPNDDVSIGFLVNALESKDYSQLNSGTAQPKLNKQSCRSIPIACPTLAEQEAIASALSDADALIESLEQLLAKKRQIKQGAMQELLTGDWPSKAFGDLFKFSGGYSASRNDLGTDGHLYLHYGDIHGSDRTFVDVEADAGEIPRIDIPLSEVSQASLLDHGDVVFVDASEDVDGTNKHVVIDNPEGRLFIAGLHTIVAKRKTNEINPSYMRYCFQTPEIKEQFRFYAVGTKVSGVSKTSIAKIVLAMPSPHEQAEIAATLDAMEQEIELVIKRLAKSRQLKQAMMQQLLTGRIRLSGVVSND